MNITYLENDLYLINANNNEKLIGELKFFRASGIAIELQNKLYNVLEKIAFSDNLFILQLI